MNRSRKRRRRPVESRRRAVLEPLERRDLFAGFPVDLSIDAGPGQAEESVPGDALGQIAKRDESDPAALSSAEIMEFANGVQSFSEWLQRAVQVGELSQELALVDLAISQSVDVQRILDSEFVEPLRAKANVATAVGAAEMEEWIRNVINESHVLSLTGSTSALQVALEDNELRVNLQLTIQQTHQDVPLDWEQLLGGRGLLVVGGGLEVAGSLRLDLAFGLDLSAAELTRSERFSVAPRSSEGHLAELQLKVSTSDLALEGRVGLLGVEVSEGVVDLEARAFVSAVPPEPALGQRTDRFTLNQLSAGVIQEVAAVEANGQLNARLPIQGRLGEFVTSAHITVADANLFDESAPTVTSIGFQALEDFQNLDSHSLLSLLDQIAHSLSRTKSDPSFAQSLPFSTHTSVGDLVDAGDALRAVTDLLTDANDQPSFETIQQLVTRLATLLEVDALALNPRYDPVMRELTLDVHLDHEFGPVQRELVSEFTIGDVQNVEVSDGDPTLTIGATLQANFVVGFNLTPVGNGFKLEQTTELNRLNNGRGVPILRGASDLRLLLADGSDFEVDLDGAVTVGHVQQMVSSQTNGRVRVEIDKEAARLLVIDSRFDPTLETGSTLTVMAMSDSLAGFALGILGHDEDDSAMNDDGALESQVDGVIVGKAVHGDTLAGHAFVQDASLVASVSMVGEGITATANLGSLTVEIEDGTVHADVEIFAQLVDPGTNSADGRIDLLELNVGARELSSLILADDLNGRATMTLPARVRTAALKTSIPEEVTIAVDWPEMGDRSTVSVTVAPEVDVLLGLERLSIHHTIDAVKEVHRFLIQLEDVPPLREPLPLFNRSLSEVVGLSQRLGNVVQSLERDPPLTLDELQSRLTDAGAESMFQYTNNVLSWQLNLAVEEQISIPLNLSLVEGLMSVAATSGIGAQFRSELDLGIELDVSDRSAPKLYLKDSSELEFSALVDEQGIDMEATLASLGLFVRDGRIRLDNGQAGQAAVYRFGLTEDPEDGRHAFSTLNQSGVRTSDFNGSFRAALPVYYPTRFQLLDRRQPGVEFRIGDLADPASTSSLKVPDFSLALDRIDVNDTLDSVVDGWGRVVDMIQTSIDVNTEGHKLPLIGNQVDKLATFLDELRDRVTAKLEQRLSESVAVQAEVVRDALYEALGPSGLDWLQDNPRASDGRVGPEDIRFAATLDDIHFDMLLGDSGAVLDESIAFDIGLDGLGLDVDGRVRAGVGFSFDLGFGVSRTDGFYIDAGVEDELKIEFSVSVPDLRVEGDLGVLQLRVVDEDADDNPNNQAVDLDGDQQLPSYFGGTFGIDIRDPGANDRLALSEFSTSVVEVGLDAQADVNLDLVASLPDPTDTTKSVDILRTAFHLDWTFGSDPVLAGTIEDVGFSAIEVNLGWLSAGPIGEVVSSAREVLDPVKPIIDVVTDPIPVISDLAGEISLVDLAAFFGFVSQDTRDFVTQVRRLTDFVYSVPDLGNDAWISLGGFNILNESDGDPGRHPVQIEESLGHLKYSTDEASSPEDVLEAVLTHNVGGAGEFLADERFRIPIFDDPTLAFGLLLGQDIDIITYDMPSMSLDFSYSQFFPILGPIGAQFTGSVGATADFDFGFDTTGIRQWADTGEARHIVNGFYVADNHGPEVEVTGKITAGLEVNIGIASAGVEGGIFADVGFDLSDPNADGKVHFSELVGHLENNPLCVFDVRGAVRAALQAYVEFLFFEETFEIASVTLIDLQHSCPGDSQPILATELENGDLRLNMGPYAGERVHGDVNGDAGETFEVVSGSEDGKVYVQAFGYQQEYRVARAIVADGGEGDDRVVVASDVEVRVVLNGGEGADTLEAGSGSAQLFGGGGNDLLVGGASPDTISGEEGDDFIRGAGGADTLSGGDNADIIYGDGGDDVVHGDTGGDRLHGGTGLDQLFGGVGNDQLHGDEQDDALSGGPGNDRLQGDSGDDQLFGESGDDLLSGNDGNDTLAGGQHNDTLSGGAGVDTLMGEHGDDELAGGADGDLIMGGSGADSLSGGAGGDELHGDSGDDELNGDSGDDHIWGGTGADRLSGGAGQDELYGGNNNDTLLGGLGSDMLFGEGGADHLSGNDGRDSLSGGGGRDVLWGGRGDDRLDGGAGADDVRGHGGDDIFVVSFDDSSATSIDELSGGVNSDIISIVGTANDDHYRITQISASTYLAEDRNEGDSFSFTLPADIETVKVEAGDGHDTVELDENVKRGMVLFGGEGDDTLTGGSGRDILMGGAGSDLLQGRAGEDQLHGGQGDDQLLGGRGSDALYGQAGSDNLNGGEGRDLQFGGAGADYLQAGDGALGDVMYGDGGDEDSADDGADTIIGGDGVDVIFGDGGDDRLEGRGLSDIIHGGDGNDLLIGGQGRDLLFGEQGDDELAALQIGQVVDDDQVNDQWLQVYAALRDREDELFEQINALVMEKNTVEDRRDQLVVELAADDLALAERDLLEADLRSVEDELESLDVRLEMLSNDQALINLTQIDINPYQTVAIDILDGGSGSDRLWGSPKPDHLIGNSGADTIHHSAGNDQVYGGTDPLTNEGDHRDQSTDTYVVDGSSDDDDIMLKYESTNELPDAFFIYVGGVKGPRADHLGIERVGVRGLEGHDTITVDFGRNGSLDVWIDGGDGDDLIDVSGDSANALAPLEADAELLGGEGNDTILGGLATDTIAGGGGDDLVYYSDGPAQNANDQYDGGAGTDQFVIESMGVDGAGQKFIDLSGNNVIAARNRQLQITLGADPADQDRRPLTEEQFRRFEALSVTSESGDDTVVLDNSFDTLKSLHVDAGAGNDSVEVGVGRHTIQGGTGVNSLVVVGDDASNSIVFSGNREELLLEGDVSATTYGFDDVTVAAHGGDDRIDGSRIITNPGRICIGFCITLAELPTTIPLILSGGSGNDTLMGAGGDDQIAGGTGNDEIHGGSGNDNLLGDEGSDTLRGGNGNDTLDGGAQLDRLFGDTGNDQLWYRGDRDDFLGGAGSDRLVAAMHSGQEVVIYQLGFLVNGSKQAMGAVSEIEVFDIDRAGSGGGVWRGAGEGAQDFGLYHGSVYVDGSPYNPSVRGWDYLNDYSAHQQGANSFYYLHRRVPPRSNPSHRDGNYSHNRAPFSNYDTLGQYGLITPAMMHPGNLTLSIVEWRAPAGGVYDISGSFADLDPAGGDGVGWFIDKNSRPGGSRTDAGEMATGTIPNGDGRWEEICPPPLRCVIGGRRWVPNWRGADLRGVSLDEGDRIYFGVDPRATWNNDSTGVRISVIAKLIEPPEPSVTLAVDNTAISEEGGTATFRALLSERTTVPVTVDLEITGSATEDADYAVSNGQLVIPVGATEGEVSVTALPDAINEPDESIVVGIRNVINGRESGSQQVSTTIQNVDEPLSFSVTSFDVNPSGFQLQFSRELDTSELNLFDTATSGVGLADVVVTGARSGPVAGSLIVDTTSVTFIRTGGPLVEDTYTVQLRSNGDGLKDVDGELLDGDSDGIGGDDYTTSFRIDAPAANFRMIGISDFVRGPGQIVNVPADSTTGIPITISDGREVRAVDVRIRYDQTQLEITGAIAPAGGTVVLSTETPGLAILTFWSVSPLPEGEVTFIHLQASVPAGSAEYGSQHLLDVHGVVVGDGNDNEFPTLVDDGIHVVSYFGDVSGNGRINASDAALVGRKAALLDAGFAAYPLVDPKLIGDISGNARTDAADASRIARFAALHPIPQIPSLPGSTVFPTQDEDERVQAMIAVDNFFANLLAV